jgi:hypothetical protein
MCLDVCGCVWICVDVCGCVWMSISVRVCIDTRTFIYPPLLTSEQNCVYVCAYVYTQTQIHIMSFAPLRAKDRGPKVRSNTRRDTESEGKTENKNKK